ncbi:hypothetical protein Ancab_036790 [Ancistrocladus abbreviatus]
MGTWKVLCFLPFFLFPVICTAQSYCPISICDNSTFAIRFPFWLQDQQSQYCGYPGFDLTCNDQGSVVLTLAHAGQFLVRSINYTAQNLQIYEADDCLPKRLRRFDLSGSPFSVDRYVNYTFLSCSELVTTSALIITVDCLGDSTRPVMATSSTELAKSMAEKCQKLYTLLVPVSMVQENVNSSSLVGDLQLKWDQPNCRECEENGGICGLQNALGPTIGCFDNSSGDYMKRPVNGMQVFRIIALSVAVPIILCAATIGIFLCFLLPRGSGIRANRSQQAAVIPQPSETVMGLDQSTIDSYTKTVLGESRRVPGLNDGTCPICLSEYKAKETIRCISDCQHCFHADCIDEWLRLNGTCPICRSSPSPAHAV